MKLTHLLAASLTTLGLLAISLAGSPSPSTVDTAPAAASSSVIATGCPVSYDCDAPNGDVLGTFGSLGACRTFCSPRGGICERVFC